MRFAFLGPAGTYGEQATRQLAELEGVANPELVPQLGIRAVVQALAHGTCDAAVVPVENSVEGGVTACLDALWEHPDLSVARALVPRGDRLPAGRHGAWPAGAGLPDQ